MMLSTTKYIDKINIGWINRDKVVYKLITVTLIASLFYIFLAYFISAGSIVPSFLQSDDDIKWTYSCVNKVCLRQLYESGEHVSLEKCNMLCYEPQLWPNPKTVIHNEKDYSSFNIEQMYLKSYLGNPAKNMLRSAYQLFRENLLTRNLSIGTSDNLLLIEVKIRDSKEVKLKLTSYEGYSLDVNKEDTSIKVNITAQNFFGARHGLETLSQLIWFDGIDNNLNILHGVHIRDNPSFPFRGLMVDTARNYFPLPLLKKIIAGMSANKLNVFHWHLTDSHSFPFAAPRYPDLAKYGAYSPEMVYTSDDIKELIEYAIIRGVRILIEIDAPSHILSGWEYIKSYPSVILDDPDSVNGQLNPETARGLQILYKLYKDILSLVDDDEIFHIGGDEVNLSLWDKLVDNKNIYVYDYWGKYIKKMVAVLTAANGGKEIQNVIMWSSGLSDTSMLLDFLNPNTTVVHYWFGERHIFENNHMKVIYSNVENWYLDCGFGPWQEIGGTCKPYATWQSIYRAVPWEFLETTQNVLGGEACMWTEMVGEYSLETRIWPRSAAFAERIWSDPPVYVNVSLSVYTRLDSQRERMNSRGIRSEVMWPRYCTLNPGRCY